MPEVEAEAISQQHWPHLLEIVRCVQPTSHVRAMGCTPCMLALWWSLEGFTRIDEFASCIYATMQCYWVEARDQMRWCCCRLGHARDTCIAVEIAFGPQGKRVTDISTSLAQKSFNSLRVSLLSQGWMLAPITKQRPPSACADKAALL